MIAVHFSDATYLSGIFGAVLVLILAGLPWRLIQNLRLEREERERLYREKTDALHAKDAEMLELRARYDAELAELRAKTDLSAFGAKLDTIESGMSGAFAGLSVEHREMIKALGQISAALTVLATSQKGAS